MSPLATARAWYGLLLESLNVSCTSAVNAQSEAALSIRSSSIDQKPLEQERLDQ